MRNYFTKQAVNSVFQPFSYNIADFLKIFQFHSFRQELRNAPGAGGLKAEVVAVAK